MNVAHEEVLKVTIRESDETAKIRDQTPRFEMEHNKWKVKIKNTTTNTSSVKE
jgi:hypothetical protein